MNTPPRISKVTLQLRQTLAAVSLAFSLCCHTFAQPDPNWKVHDYDRPRPPVIDPGTPSTFDQPGKPPSDATVLFDGKDLVQWVNLDGSPPKWIAKGGSLECVKGSGYIRTLQNFGDCQLHVEWAAPTPPQGTSQGRGNSGVFLMGLYEVQVLDSYENKTYADGQAGAAYGQYPPLVNASRPPGQWQIYDIIFTRPRFDAKGEVVSAARMTVLHNGVLVQNNVTLTGPTGWLLREPYRAHADKLPLSLQDHGNPVRFRNIWIRELGDDGKWKAFTFSTKLLDRYVGSYRVDDTLSIEVTRKENQLIGQFKGRDFAKTFSFLAESPTRFFTRNLDGTLTFRTNPNGDAEGVTFHIGGEDRQGQKVQ